MQLIQFKPKYFTARCNMFNWNVNQISGVLLVGCLCFFFHSFLSSFFIILQMKLPTVVFPSTMQNWICTPLIHAWKHSWCCWEDSGVSRRQNSPWYYSLRQVKRWDSASVSQNRAGHMFSVNMTSRLPMWKIAAGHRMLTFKVLRLDK